MSVVATRDLGQLGPSETQPVLVEWRWYYHLPELTIWILVAALLILMKENRNREAWTILIPAILLTMFIWPLIARAMPSALFSLFCFTRDEQAEFAFKWLIGAWTAVWLMAPWLARRRAAVAFAFVLAFLLLSGTVAHVCAFSGALTCFSSTNVWCRYLFPAILWYGTCAVAMLWGMTFSAIRCRNTYSPRRFRVWLAIGILPIVFVGTAVYVYSLIMLRVPSIFRVVAGVGVMSLGVAVFTYLVNLPFLYLADQCPCYRDRLHNLLKLPNATREQLGVDSKTHSE